MKLGAVYFFTDDGPDVIEFAQTAEGSGFESLFFPEHTHFPLTRKTPYPPAYGGGELPSFYLHTVDQIVAMSMVAAKTETMTLGTGICLIAQHDPISKAKELATLDFLSGGRVICGVAPGWNQDEAEAHGVEWKKRFSIMRDKVKVMQALWTQEEASYEGEQASLAPSWAWPKPAQKAGPPIWLGGAGPTTMRHVARWADCWYVVPPPDDPTLERVIPQFWDIVDEEGRDRDSLSIAVASAPPDPAILEKYIEQGVAQANLWIDPADSPAQGMKNLEAVTKVLQQMKG